MIKPGLLSIQGYQNQPLPNRFYRQEPPAAHLAVLFPGLGYHPDLPLLYYTHQVLLAHGFDTLQLRPDYQTEAFQSASAEGRLEWMAADAAAALKAGLAQGNYQRVALAGKSIGTLSMALCLPFIETPRLPITIWLTPLLREALVVEAALNCQAPLFFIAGTGDSTFVPATMALIQKRTGAQVFLAENANHSLEIPDAPLKSLDFLTQSMGALSGFLDQAMEG
jgi:hypothetical protein